MITDAMGQNKTEKQIEQKVDAETHKNVPSSEELLSICGPEVQSIEDYVEFNEIPDILLEKELCWPVEPDLVY